MFITHFLSEISRVARNVFADIWKRRTHSRDSVQQRQIKESARTPTSEKRSPAFSERPFVVRLKSKLLIVQSVTVVTPHEVGWGQKEGCTFPRR